MDTTTLYLDTAVTVSTTSFDHGDVVFYNLGDTPVYRGFSGTVMVKPSRFGMHPSYGVMVTFGGYSGHIQAGDWSVSGSLVCTGTDMAPGPASPCSQYPLNQVRSDDPATADLLAALVTAIAFDYIDHYTGCGQR